MWKQVSRRMDAFEAGATGGGMALKLVVWKTLAAAALVALGVMAWKYQKACALTQDLRKEITALQEKNEAGDRHDVIGQSIQNEQILPPIVKQPAAGAPEESPVAKAPFAQKNVSRPLGKTPTVEGKKEAPTYASADNDSVQAANNLEPEKTLAAENAPDTAVLAAKALPEPPAELAAALLQLTTKPVTTVGQGRYRVGLHATLGFVQPKQRGVSSITGHGLSAEVRVWRSLWATGAVDFVRQEVSTTGFFPKFHHKLDSLPKPPPQGGPGPKPTPKLARVESSPRDQHFQLGIRYELPLRLWARPSVRLAHTWVRRSPSLVTFKFEEPDPAPNPGPPKPAYIAEKFDAKWINNQWRIGIGLERDIPNWTFSLWADYSKNMSAPQANFDALYLRAGAQYRF
jgi:hypothetical protein